MDLEGIDIFKLTPHQQWVNSGHCDHVEGKTWCNGMAHHTDEHWARKIVPPLVKVKYNDNNGWIEVSRLDPKTIRVSLTRTHREDSQWLR